ncbi:amino acid amidase [Polymorphobacter glacialis]|uniref:Amino acid amidase n=1 Tax=Sandarakinorhabdus glacialis TaxID=1614636 RepID=A0A916ZM34_9SPHN|nr:proline iminopeptidase-family hydrolase [Polymorphobacter glacialis]GGE04272.1 amino acid amidase [Polymorphobacter glacialis]
MAAGAGLLGAGLLGAAAPGGVRIRPDFEMMVPVPGGRVYVRVNGDLKGPRPPIVMLHGGPGSSHWYFLNATALADERAVILYDQLDSGRSEAPGDAANWVVPRFVAELESVRAALGVARWHVLGASWGATVALEYAARRPRELAGLVLQSPLVSTAAWLADARALKDAMPAGVRELLDKCDVAGAAPQADCDAATAAFYARHVRMAEPTADIAAYKSALPRSFSDDIYHHMWGRAEFTASGTLKDYDGRALLKRLDGRRTLFVAGQHDEARPGTVAGFARDVPGGADFAEIADAAHSVMNDNPEAYLAVLRGWLLGLD